MISWSKNCHLFDKNEEALDDAIKITTDYITIYQRVGCTVKTTLKPVGLSWDIYHSRKPY